MSFRPFNLNFRHAAVAGLACLAFVGVARAGEGSRNIEVVPFHNNSMDTNFDQPGQDDSQKFKIWEPNAPNSLRASSRPTKLAPLPQSQPSISREEQEMLDRRRNWVFMTPEDYATTDTKTGKGLLGDDNKDVNMTAMERFYHRLEQSAKPTTNDFGQINPDGLSARTNSFGVAVKTTDSGMFGQRPFDSSQEVGVFQSITAGGSANVFGNNNNATLQSSEDVRVQAAQKAHMENFKQLWDIDQASSAATPAPTPSSTPVDSAPLFGTSTPGLPTTFKPNLPAMPTAFPNSSKPVLPVSQPIAPKYTPPAHSDFMPPQRPF